MVGPPLLPAEEQLASFSCFIARGFDMTKPLFLRLSLFRWTRTSSVGLTIHQFVTDITPAVLQ